MSIAIHADGHVGIELLYEQHRPHLSGQTVKSIECDDLILRNYGTKPLRELYVLSPNEAVDTDGNGQPVFDLLAHDDTKIFDWIFSQQTNLEGLEGVHCLSFVPADSDRSDVKFEATKLEPIVDVPAWMTAKENLKASGTFWGTKMTLMKISFKDGKVIRPYNPNESAETTYWIRLCFQPEMSSPLPKPTRLELAHGLDVLVETCAAMEAQAILDCLNVRLDLLSMRANLKKMTTRVRELLLPEMFHKPGTSTVVKHHRMSLITDQNFLVLNPYVAGNCVFAGVHSVVGNEDMVARTWFGGADRFWTNDILRVARHVYEYLKERAYNEEDAISKEQLARSLTYINRNNVYHVLQALTELGFASYFAPNLYSVGPAGKEKEFFITDEGACNNPAIRDEFERLLTVLNSPLSISDDPTRSTMFVSKGFRIQYELVYSAGQKTTDTKQRGTL